MSYVSGAVTPVDGSVVVSDPEFSSVAMRFCCSLIRPPPTRTRAFHYSRDAH
jgi:hypothetical protein